jgi:hypothetical protein
MELILAIAVQAAVVGGLATWMVKKERRLRALDEHELQERRG